MTFLRTLAATGWLALALLVSVVLTLGYDSCDANRDAKAVRHAGTVKGELAVANAGQAATHAAVTASENAAEAARDSQASRTETTLKSSPRPAPPLLSVLSLALALALALTLACASCASAPPMPMICRSVRAWVAFAEAQTGRLEVANANRNAVVQIVDACGRQQAAIREALKPKPRWRRLFD